MKRDYAEILEKLHNQEKITIDGIEKCVKVLSEFYQPILVMLHCHASELSRTRDTIAFFETEVMCQVNDERKAFLEKQD